MRKEGIVQGWDARRRLALAAQQAAAGSCSDSDKRRAGTISFEPLTPSWPAFAAALADCAFVAIALVVAYAAADPEERRMRKRGGGGREGAEIWGNIAATAEWQAPRQRPCGELWLVSASLHGVPRVASRSNPEGTAGAGRVWAPKDGSWQDSPCEDAVRGCGNALTLH